ncbi:MAG: glycosyltransferase [Paracoccaceae bacterium]
MKVVVWGTYDLGKPRTRILISGLEQAGVEVEQIHTDIWRGVEDKSQIGVIRRVGFLFRWLLAYPWLVVRYLRSAPHDAVLVPYLGQFDVLILWPFARLRRRPVVWDMFISLYDTVVIDRAMVRRNGLLARALWAIEWCSCHAADLILMDTGPHARYVERQFSLQPGRVQWLPVGVEPATFPRLPPAAPHGGGVRVLFFGQMIPLHGVSTILNAAADRRGQAYQWHLIGSGQEEAKVRDFIAQNASDNITWEEWVPYEDLNHRIGASDVCLGIFGTSEKAASVIPNKVYQAISTGRSIVTRESDAIDDLLQDEKTGIKLVPPADSNALLTAIQELDDEGFPQPGKALLDRMDPAGIGMRLRQMIAALPAATPENRAAKSRD